MLASRPEDPRPKILGHIGRGASHDAGRSRVSVRRTVQAVSGFVIRQRPRVDSRAVIPSLAWHRPQSRVTKRRRYGRPVLEDLAADDPHRHYRAAAYHAIRSTLPEDVPLWPVIGQDGQCLIHIKEAILDRPKAMCQPSESYSDVILRLKSAHC